MTVARISHPVAIADARPGDRVTITGTIQGGYPGFRLRDGVLLLRDADYNTADVSCSGVDYQIDRDVPTTDQEPPGLGAVVRTIGTGEYLPLVYVRVAATGDRRWRIAVNLTTPVSWSEVLDCSVSGVVEVLTEGWIE